MGTFYVRRPPRARETLEAAALAAGVGICVGAAAFYLVRVLLARERVGQGGGSSGVGRPGVRDRKNEGA